jgi:reductive dehalogenase
VFFSFADYVGAERAAELRELRRERTARFIDRSVPGFSLPDRALAFGAQTVWQSTAQEVLYSWTSTRPEVLESLGLEEEQPGFSEGKAALLVKKAARFYGALMVGIAELNRGHVYSHDYLGRPIRFREAEQPEVTREQLTIPDSCRWVVALVVPQDWETMMAAPNALSSAAVAFGYSTMPVVAGSLAEFIRTLGYNAIPCGNDTALSVPIAVDAGLGEVGRHARLITPKYGSNVRLAKVITDLPLKIDKPIDFGVTEFCETCKKCAQYCPFDAIPEEREPSYRTQGPWNRKGVKMWHEHAPKCYEQWQRETTGCSICVRVCPYNHPNTLPHQMVKAAISTTTAFNSLFVWADDALGLTKSTPARDWWLESNG